jgi:2-methylcitrate dehydratase PrpD
MSDKPLAVQLGAFVSGLTYENLPADVVDKGKALINHSVTVALACSGAPRVRSARAAVTEHEGLGRREVGQGQGATVWVTGDRATRVGAVFVNGVAVSVNQQCDSYHMLTHPGVLIIPAAIATAESEGRSGRELLTAIIAGYEVQCRVARDFIPSTQARGYRSSPTYGILGCAATVAKLLRLDAERTTNAIALAASFAGSLIEGQRTGIVDADFAEAQAARNGLWAATLAAQGFAGAPTALEGAGGFYNAFTGNNKGDLTYAFNGPLSASFQEVVADLGRRWEVLDVKFKIYPTPGFNQPVAWLTAELVREHGLKAETIEHVRLEMNYLETLYPSPRFPRSTVLNGVPFGRTTYTLACTVVNGEYPVTEDYEFSQIGGKLDESARAQISALQRKVEVIGEVGRECFAPRITFTLKDGRQVSGEYHGRELMWNFAKDAEVLRRLVPALPIEVEQYDRLVDMIAHIDHAASVDDLVRLTLAR